MGIPDEPLVTVLAFELALAGGILYLTWRRRSETVVAKPLLAILGLVFLWQSSHIAFMLAPTRELVVFFFHLAWTSEYMLALPWFVFGFYYTGNGNLLTLKRLSVLFAPYILMTGVLWTNPLHYLYFTSYTFSEPELVLMAAEGPVFWAQIAYGYTLVAVSMVLIADKFVSSPTYRRPVGLLLVGVAITWISTVIHFSGVFGQERLNLAAYTIVSVPVLWYVAIFRMGVLDVLPIARDQVLDIMEEGVLVADATAQIIDANPAAQRRLGTDQPLVGRQLTAVFEDRLDDPSVLVSGDPTHHEVTVEHGAEDRYLDIRSQPIDPEQIEYAGDEAGHLVLLRDITPIREREKELERQNEQLDRFASVISHDLRSPLTVAAGNIGFVRKQVEGEAATLLDQARDALDRMNDLIDDVLLLAREGETIEAVSPVNLASLTTDAWENIDAPEAAMETHLDDAVVRADGDQLQRVFENLFRNAVEHGGEDVTIEVGVHDEGFYVADDGPGIPEAERERVFESGYTTGGTGLGLEIVRTIVQAHGWNVSVTESEAGGARFDITNVDFA